MHEPVKLDFGEKYDKSEFSSRIKQSSSLTEHLILSGTGLGLGDEDLDCVMHENIKRIRRSFPYIRTITLQNGKVDYGELVEPLLDYPSNLSRLEISNVELTDVPIRPNAPTDLNTLGWFSVDVKGAINIDPLSEGGWNSGQEDFFTQLKKQCPKISEDELKSLSLSINEHGKKEKHRRRIERIISS